MDGGDQVGFALAQHVLHARIGNLDLAVVPLVLEAVLAQKRAHPDIRPRAEDVGRGDAAFHVGDGLDRPVLQDDVRNR